MLAALNLGAVLLGVATAGLATSLIGLILGFLLNALGITGGPDIGLVVGVVVGLGSGGWVSGTRARHSERFHGAVTGLLVAFVLMIIARLGGSPAATPTIIWMAALAVFISGLFGWLAGRRKRARL